MRDVVPRMNGGAVMEERSPLKDAIDCEVRQYEIGNCRCACHYLEERGPRALVLRGYTSAFVFRRARH